MRRLLFCAIAGIACAVSFHVGKHSRPPAPENYGEQGIVYRASATEAMCSRDDGQTWYVGKPKFSVDGYLIGAYCDAAERISVDPYDWYRRNDPALFSSP